MKATVKITKINKSNLEMSSNIIGKCDDCATAISSSDKYLKLSDSLFCEAHTCMLSEIIEEVRLCVEQRHVMEFYKTLHEQECALQEMHRELVENGDRKFVSNE